MYSEVNIISLFFLCHLSLIEGPLEEKHCQNMFQTLSLEINHIQETNFDIIQTSKSSETHTLLFIKKSL